ncbi:MFS transporter [Haematospirillum jordaniae]|nr:MFS transporter [Haematospirillum jordaniae]
MFSKSSVKHDGMSAVDHKTLCLAALGGALEIYDFIIFVFFALTISQLFFPPEGPEWFRLLQTVCVFAAGYLARPLGGILMAHFADRHGRKKAFSLSILMMALPCFVIGAMPTYAEIGYLAPGILLLLRIIQGAAVGGEVPSAWVFVAEHAPAHRRGYSLGLLQAGLTLGYLLAAIVATLLAKTFTPEEMLDYGWRLPFLIGGFFGITGVWLRQWLNETPLFIRMATMRDRSGKFPLGDVVRTQSASLIPAVILTCVLASAVIVLVVVTPTMLQKLFGMSAESTFSLSCVAIMCLNIGCVIAGMVVDRIGAWKGVMLYSVLLPIGVTVLYAGILGGGAWLIAACVVSGLCCGIVGTVPSVMVGLFPTEMRVSGISLTYNIAYSLWASFTPPLLIALMPENTWICVWFALGMGVIGLITASLYRHRCIRMVSIQGTPAEA